MGIANFFTNEKAIIEVLDLRQLEEAQKKEPPGSNSKIPPTPIQNQMALGNFKSMFGGNQLDLVNTLSKSVTKNPWFADLNVTAQKKYFEVQFNPNDLQIEGYGGGRIASTAYNNPGDNSKKNSSSINMLPMTVYIKLNVKLLFDRCDPNDSFLSAKTNIAPSELTKSAIKTVVKAATKKKLTVQQEVEGLIAALRSPYTRCITFNWGDMSYEGILNRVASQYTMFNSSGEPVRAVVQLSLVCADQSVSANSLGAWQESYEEAFGAGSQSLVSIGQKVGSLFNIGK